MVDPGQAARAGSRRGDARRSAVLAAAVDEFSAHGIQAASMARIAERAGISRPALYQYFANRDDIFASAFIALFEDHVERALAALGADGSTSDRLDGFLQRFHGDLWQHMAASPHTDEIIEAKSGDIAERVLAVIGELQGGLTSWLADASAHRGRAGEAARRQWLDLLTLSPKGLRFDQPPVDVYRRRLSTLARCVAADLDQGMID